MTSKSAVFGFSMGLCFAVSMGLAFHSVALGTAFGIALGVVFAAAGSAASETAVARKNAAAVKPLPDPLGLFTR